jgi:C-terminal processing protease CtpA/Prc
VYAIFLNNAKATLIDWEALKAHKERLSPQANNLEDALVSRNGQTLYYLAKFDKGYDLWTTDLQTKESKMILPLHVDEAGMEWDKEQQNIFLLADGKILKIDPVPAKQELINTAGRMSLNPAAERRSMFEHVWRRTKETFYTSGMHGTDWDAYKESYEKYLPDINNNYDFAEMLNELLGELNASHTGVSYRDSKKDKDITASLGAFYNQAYPDTGMQIEALIPGGPLDDPALDIKAGTIIEAIDGKPITPDRDFAQYLNRKAGKNTMLSIRNGNSRAVITVKPLSPEEENDLLYKRWVKRNEAETDSLSHGELGYVHLYRMNDAAYRNVYEYALGKYAGRKGLVIDTRFNRGGDLASELSMFLSGSRLRDNTTDHFLVSVEPSFRWTKPSIVLANEANYSDGHCFVYDYQYLHLGKLVGMPIPGSCTFQTGQSLPDNTLQWSAPTLGVKNLQGQYLENRQTEPDLRVMNEFDKVSTGRDQQLEAAIGQLLKEIKAQ